MAWREDGPLTRTFEEDTEVSPLAALMDSSAWHVDINALVLVTKARPSALEAYTTPHTDLSPCARASIPGKGKFTASPILANKSHYEIYESILMVYHMCEKKLAAILTTILLFGWICYLVAQDMISDIHKYAKSITQKSEAPVQHGGVTIPHAHAAKMISGDLSALPEEVILDSVIVWSTDEPEFPYTIPTLDAPANNVSSPEYSNALFDPLVLESGTWCQEPEPAIFNNSESSWPASLPVTQENYSRTTSELHLFLDIDGTLVHSMPARLHTPDQGTPDLWLTEIFAISYKRPGIDTFLAFCFQNFKSVSIWTAGTEAYAQAIARRLAPQGRTFSMILSRDTLGAHPTKPLMRSKNMVSMWASNSEFAACGICAENSLIIDDTPDACAWNMTNAVIVPSWTSRAHDDSCFSTLCDVFSCAQFADAAELCAAACARLCVA
eukprot:Phypoly_transcript_05505.p1 GENE.Phypoly_transcript_05505~~Phypoly_transcript_05505.p1  ORF type:complete len:468 (+),score=64.30 Phypoly_transcript_05505:86-1405(+)